MLHPLTAQQIRPSHGIGFGGFRIEMVVCLLPLWRTRVVGTGFYAVQNTRQPNQVNNVVAKAQLTNPYSRRLQNWDHQVFQPTIEKSTLRRLSLIPSTVDGHISGFRL